MAPLHGTDDPLTDTSALSPILFALGDPELLVDLLAASPAGVVLTETGPDLPVVYCNERFRHDLALDAVPAVGRPLLELLPEPERAGLAAGHARVARTGRTVEHALAGSRWRAGLHPVRDQSGAVTHVLAFLVETKAGVRSDGRAEAERRRDAQALRTRLEQATQLEQLRTDFLKLASHELRAPLGLIRGYVSMIEDGTMGEVGEAVQDALPVIRAKLDEMNRVIDEMLATARLDDGALRLRLEALDLRDVVGDAVRALGPLAEHRHQVVVDASPRPVPVRGDRLRLGMILTNLLHNAIKYSPLGGDIGVACSLRDGAATVAVTDHGVGIAARDMDTLFTRFGRVSTPETSAIPGTGLGLYLARNLARRHGGDVEVASAAGRGSTFTLTLPAEHAAERLPRPG